MTVQLEWDEAKRRTNLLKHGIDFRDLGPLFADSARLEFQDERRNYGEPRLVLLGPLHGRLLHVTSTRRGNARRIISARKANRREQGYYERATDHKGHRDR